MRSWFKWTPRAAKVTWEEGKQARLRPRVGLAIISAMNACNQALP